MSDSSGEGALRPERTGVVIAPDILLDLMGGGRGPGRSDEAARLFDAIATDVQVGNTQRPAYVAAHIVPWIHDRVENSAGESLAREATLDLLRLLAAVPLTNQEYYEAAMFRGFPFAVGVQFMTCRVVGAKYLVTRHNFGVQRTPVHRRTPAEVLPLFRKSRAID